MKVVQINCADDGSIGSIMSNIEAALQRRGDSSLVFYGLGSKSKLPDHRKITCRYENGINKRVSFLTGVRFGFAPLSTAKMIHQLKIIKPDIVHLHCPNGYMLNLYRLISYITQVRIPLVITNHCEMFYTGNCDHSYDCEKWMTGCGGCENLRSYVGPFRVDRTEVAWQKLYECFNISGKVAITSVSKWVSERSLLSPITGRFPNYIIENGVMIPEVLMVCGEEREEILNSLAEKYHIDRTKKNILFVTAHFSREERDNKGGYYFLKLAGRFLSDMSVRLIVVGSKGNEDYFPANVINIGRIYDKNELFALYELVDLCLVLSKRETFSMVCAESLCSGTPVAGFYAKGPESISIKEYARFCKYGDVDALKDVVNEMIYDNEWKHECIAKEARRRYSSTLMAEKYLSVYDQMSKHT